MVLDVLPIAELVDTYWHLETHLLLLHKVAFPILYEAVVTAVVCVHRQSYVSTGEYLCPQVCDYSFKIETFLHITASILNHFCLTLRVIE